MGAHMGPIWVPYRLLAGCLTYCGMMSISVTIIAWSLMPGIGVEVFTVDGLLVKTKSSMLRSLVG